MMNIIADTSGSVPHGIYKEKDIKDWATSTYVISGGMVAVNIKDEYTVNFSVFEFYSSESDGTDAYLECIWYGYGTGSALRECRHSWIGRKGSPGYVNYLNGALFIDAINVLKNYFDMD